MKFINNYLVYLLFFFIICSILINKNKVYNYIIKNPLFASTNKENVYLYKENIDKIKTYNSSKYIELKGLSRFNIYNKDTIYEQLKHKLTRIIHLAINNKFNIKNEYNIHNIDYVNEQIDMNNNYRYIVVFFINYNNEHISDKLFIDLVILNNKKIHINKIDNNINSYNTILDAYKTNNIHNNDSGLYDINNINNGKKYIPKEDDLYFIKNLEPYYEENIKYKEPRFCNKFSKQTWDRSGKIPTHNYNQCDVNNNAYDSNIFYPTNYPGYINDRDESDKSFNWIMYGDRIHTN